MVDDTVIRVPKACMERWEILRSAWLAGATIRLFSGSDTLASL